LFLKQTEWRDSNVPIKWKDTYKIWCEEYPDDVMGISERRYMDRNFLQYIYEKWAEDGSYSREFGELIDLIVRKLMTTKRFLQTSDQQKEEFYSKAIEKIYKYATKSYKKEKGYFFTYVTSTIRTAFYDVMKDDQNQIQIANKLLREQRSSLMATNIENNAHDLEETIEELRSSNSSSLNEKDDIIKYQKMSSLSIIEALDEFKYAPCDIQDSREGYGKFEVTEHNELKYYLNHGFSSTEIVLDICEVKLVGGNKTWVSVSIIPTENDDEYEFKYHKHSFSIKENKMIINNPTAAVFRREKYHYQFAVEIHGSNGMMNKGIIVESFHLKNTNENSGTAPSYLFNQAYIARKFGYHYFGFFSDEYLFEDEEGDKIGIKVLQKKLRDLFEQIGWEYYRSENFQNISDEDSINKEGLASEAVYSKV
jgi:DNA-directed RNA polymerase specialized sigma24 family protein